MRLALRSATSAKGAAAAFGLLAAVLAGPAAEIAAAQPQSTVASAFQLAAASAPRPTFVPGEILVQRLGPAADLDRARARVMAERVRSFPSLGIEVWRLGHGTAVGQALALLGRHELGRTLAFAEPNWLWYADQLPDDPRLSELWGLLNVGQTGGTADADIDATEAWGVVRGAQSVVIGVIDSGVDYLHEDLAANIWINQDEIEGSPGVDDDGNGYVDDFRGWDFVNDDNDPMDDYGHGTHVAGTLGAVGDNGVGVVGVNLSVRLLPIKFLDSSGTGTTDDAVAAVLYAAAIGAPITNNSWGGGKRSSALESAIRNFDGLFVAAAGNRGSTTKQYPAGYSLENILSVAATDANDLLAGFSNRGASWVDLGAPGVDILSTTPDDTYQWSSGTSMAAPHVAGAAGLLLALEPASSWRDLRDRILTTVDPLDSLSGLVATGGRLNAASAVGAPVEPPDATPPAAVTDLAVDPATTAHDWVALTWTAPGDDGLPGSASLYDLRYSTDPSSTLAFDFEAATPVEGEPVPQASGSPERMTVGGLTAETTHFFALESIDEAGNRSLLSNVVEATTGAAPPPESECANGLDDDFDGAVDCADVDCILVGLPCPPCGNHVCEAGEDCETCATDCEARSPLVACGDGVCQTWSGETCQTCAADCNGVLGGKPSGRFCCGGGPTAVPCSDPRCGPACESTAPAGSCCGDGIAAAPALEPEWSCGIDVCAPGTPGADPALFLASYYFNWNEAAGILTLGAGSRYNILGTPYADPASADVPECRVDCLGGLRAYYKDLLTGAAEGDWGDPVDAESCLGSGACCSTATDWGFWVECCVLP